MPPRLALALTACFILFLLRRGSKRVEGVSSAVWVPCCWLLVFGWKALSQWLEWRGAAETAEVTLEGSPLDRAVLFGLIAMAAVVLMRRRVGWGQTLRNNWALVIFLSYCAVSVLWSDFPFVAFKRW